MTPTNTDEYRRPLAVALLLLLPACGPTGARSPDYSAQTRNNAGSQLQALSWLAGTWIRVQDGRRFEEFWTEPDEVMMLGVNRTTRDGRATAFEYLRIEKQAGGVYYLASPGGRYPPTPFRLIDHTRQRAVFENPDHDFPQRIIYSREGQILHARIEGLQDGQPSSSSWTWTMKK